MCENNSGPSRFVPYSAGGWLNHIFQIIISNHIVIIFDVILVIYGCG